MAEPPFDPTEPDQADMPSTELDAAGHSRQRLIDRLPGGSPGLRTPSPHEPIPGLRVPKEKLRLAAVSLELPDALAALTVQIRRAEQFLRKHPGADRAQVALDHLYLPELFVGNQAFLEVRRDERGNCKIVVGYYQMQSKACHSTTGIDEFPITIRIDLCKLIPELLEAAVAAQNVVASEVLAVAEAIENSLERHRENTI